MKLLLIICQVSLLFAQPQHPAVGRIRKNRTVAVDAGRKLADQSLPADQRQELEKTRKEAVTDIVQTGAAHPKSVPVNLEAGKALASVGETGAGLEFLSRAVKAAQEGRDPKDLAEALTTRAQLNQKLGNFPAAAEDAQSVLKFAPDNRAALAIWQLSRGRRARTTDGQGAGRPATTTPAAAPAKQAEAEAPAPAPFASDAQRAETFLRGAQNASTIGDHDEAIRLANRAITLRPKDARARLLAAKVKHAANEQEDALLEAEEALRLDPKSGEAMLARARAKEALGRPHAEVLADYKEAGRLDRGLLPEHERALSRYRQIELAGQAVKDQEAEHVKASGPPDFAKLAELTKELGRKLERKLALAVGVMCALPVLFWLVGIWIRRRREDSNGSSPS